MAVVNGALLTLVVTSIILYFGISKVKNYLRLRHIKGPPGTGWSKWWLARHQLAGKLCRDLEDVAQKYGPIARIAPNWIVVSDPSEVRRIYSVHSGYQRSLWYRGFRFDPHNDSLLTATDNKEHHRIRSKVLPGYSGKGLPNQESAIDDAILKLIDLTNREYLTTTTKTPTKHFDGSWVFQFFSQDATSAMEFGQPFGYLDHNSDFNGIITAFEIMTPATAVMALFPSVLKLIKSPVLKPFLPKPTDKEGVGRLLGVVQDLVQRRYQSQTPAEKDSRPRDVLQAFIETSLTPAEVQSEALVHLLGGSDTTAAALRITFFYLSTRPSTYRALQSEVVAAFARGVNRPVISDAETKALPYLQAVIKEGLRMWPPIAGLSAKSSPTDDVICGKKVPAGTHVGWSIMAVMRDKKLFGQDADVFEPSRWIVASREAAAGTEGTKARLKEMEAVQNLVFAGGSRWECLGKRVAMMELGKVIFELFLRYDFSMADPIEPFHWNNYGFTLHEKMNFVVTKRERMTAVSG